MKASSHLILKVSILSLTGVSLSASAQTRPWVANGDYYSDKSSGGAGTTYGTSGTSGSSSQQAWQRQLQLEEADRTRSEFQFQQQQQAIQALGTSLGGLFQGLFESPITPNYDDSEDDYRTYTRPTPSVQPTVNNSYQPAPERARPLFSESLASFATGSPGGAPAGQDSLSSYFNSGASASSTSQYSSSPEMDRFVREDIAWQHAYFDTIAKQNDDGATKWQDVNLPIESLAGNPCF